MIRFVLIIFFSLLFFSNGHGNNNYRAYMCRSLIQSDFLEQSLGVVEIKSQLKGTGIPILIDNEPYILTNSHILGDRDHADVIIPVNTANRYFQCWFQEKKNYSKRELDSVDLFGPLSYSRRELIINGVTVDFKSRLADITILKLPKSILSETANLIKNIAIRNIKITKPTDQFPYGIKPYGPEINQTGLSNIINGKSHPTKLVMPFNKPMYIGDRYISGLYRRIIVLAMFAYPGLSGGAFYNHGELRGMLTKVALGATPDTYVIPIEEIGRLLIQHYYDVKISNRDMKKIDKAFCDAKFHDRVGETKQEKKYYIKESGLLEDFQNCDFELEQGKIANGGGEIANGGGEIANGGGEIANGGGFNNNKLWKLQINFMFNPTGDKIINTFNPFQLVEHPHEMNKFIYIKKMDRNNKNIFYGNTIAKRNWLKTFKKIKWGYKSIIDLKSERSKNVKSCYPKYVRWYKKTVNNKFIAIINHHTNIGDSAQALFPEGKLYNENSLFLSMLEGNSNKIIDGYHQSYPIMARRAEESLLDIKTSKRAFNLLYDGRTLEMQESLKVQIPKDLSVINLEVNFRKMVLDQQSKDVTYKIIFHSNDNRYRGIILFDSDNIAKVDRIFIETPKYMYEFLSCTPGVTCLR